MKKFLLLFLVMFFAVGLIRAEEVTVTFSNAGFTNGQEITSYDLNDVITIAFDKGSNSNGTKYYNSGNALRMYKSNVMTVTAAAGYDIKSVAITTPGNSNSYLLDANAVWDPEGTVSKAQEGENKPITTTWTGSARKVTLTNGTGTSGHTRITVMTVTYETAAAVDVYAPDVAMLPKNKVEITCITEGAQIFYSTDGSENLTTAYTEPFTITENCTVKAIAKKDGKQSEVTSKNVNLNYVATLAEFVALANPTEVEVGEPLTAVYKGGNYLYVTAGNTPLLLYGFNMPEYQNGDVIPAGVSGSYNLRNNNPQMAVNSATLGTATAGTPVEPTQVNVEDVSEDMRNLYVVFKDVNLDYTSTSSATLTDANNETLAVYNNNFKIELASGRYDLYGFINYYKETPQLCPVKAESLLETVATPTLSHEPGELEPNTNVTASCATAGATIHYTTDGSEPTAESAVFPATGLTLTTGMTVSIIAVKEGMNNSKVARYVYTIKGEVRNDVTFDFTLPSSLDPAQEAPVSGTGVDVYGLTFTAGHCTLTTSDKADGSNTGCRLWLLTNDRGSVLRVYKTDYLIVEATDDYVIKNIVFTVAQNAVCKPSFDEVDGSYDATDYTFTAKEGGLQRVKMTFADRSDISKITVELDDKVGIDDIESDSAADAPAEYFNLQGIRVNSDNLTPGIYIVRRGDKVSKTLVR